MIKKKIFALILSLAMVVTMMPAMVFTVNAEEDEYTVTVNNCENGWITCYSIFDDVYSRRVPEFEFGDNAVKYTVTSSDSSVYFWTMAAKGYELDKITVNGKVLSADSSQENVKFYPLEVSADSVIDASFKKVTGEEVAGHAFDLSMDNQAILKETFYDMALSENPDKDEIYFKILKDTATILEKSHTFGEMMKYGTEDCQDAWVKNMINLIALESSADAVNSIYRFILEEITSYYLYDLESGGDNQYLTLASSLPMIEEQIERCQEEEPSIEYVNSDSYALAAIGTIFANKIIESNTWTEITPLLEGKIGSLEVRKCILRSDIIFEKMADIIEVLQNKKMDDISSTISGMIPIINEEIAKCIEADDTDDVYFQEIMYYIIKNCSYTKTSERRDFVDADEQKQYYIETVLSNWDSNIRARYTSKSYATVYWDRNGIATGYEIYAVDGTNFKLIGTVTGGRTESFKTNVLSTRYAVKPIRNDYSISTGRSVVYKGDYSDVAKTKLSASRILSLKRAGKKKVAVKVAKVAAAKSYTIKYKVAGKSWKTTTSKKLKRTLKRLKRGKKVYVKVRANSSIAGKKLYSTWSTTKKIKVK